MMSCSLTQGNIWLRHAKERENWSLRTIGSPLRMAKNGSTPREVMSVPQVVLNNFSINGLDYRGARLSSQPARSLKVETRYCLYSNFGSEPHLSVPFRPGLRTVHLPHFHRSDRLNGKGGCRRVQETLIPGCFSQQPRTDCGAGLNQRGHGEKREHTAPAHWR